MAKYEVKCYYQYVGSVEVEADSIEEAYEKGFAICDKMSTEDLEYVDYMDAEVIDEEGFIHEYKQYVMNYEVVCWPESQMLMEKEGFYDNCSLINSDRGLEEFGSSAYLVDKDWYQKFINGELSDAVYDDDDADELDICYDDSIIFGDDDEWDEDDEQLKRKGEWMCVLDISTPRIE